MEFAEELAITIRVALPGRRPFVEIFQFHAENGGLQGVQTTIHSQQFVNVLVTSTVDMQQAETIGQSRVAGRNQATVACGAEILGGEKAETTDSAKAANWASGIARADGLCGVFDDGNALRRSKLQNRIHIRRQAKKMDGHDGCGFAE